MIRAAKAAWGLCAWSVRCNRPAETTRLHPTFGSVPICVQCDIAVSLKQLEEVS